MKAIPLSINGTMIIKQMAREDMGNVLYFKDGNSLFLVLVENKVLFGYTALPYHSFLCPNKEEFEGVLYCINTVLSIAPYNERKR